MHARDSLGGAGVDRADAVHRQLQDLRQRAVDVVHHLGRRPDGQLAVHPGGGGRMLLHGQVRVALVEEDVLPDVVGLPEAGLQVAELVADHPVDVGVVPPVIVDALIPGLLQRLLDGHHRLQLLVLDLDGVAGRGRDLFVGGGHRGDRVADVAHLLVLQGALVLRHREDAEADREVVPGDDRVHARDSLGGAGVDRADAAMGDLGAEDPAVEHAWQQDVVRVDGDPGDLGRGVDLGEGLAYDF